MTSLHRLLAAALGLLLFATDAAAQDTVAIAANADVIAVASPATEKRLLRAHFDRAAGQVSLVPFGPPDVEQFAVAPNGAFTVTSAVQARTSEMAEDVAVLVLLDESGRALGEPLRSSIGTITHLTVSPKGDRVAASSDKGWMAVLAVEGAGATRRLVLRSTFGVSPNRDFTFAFRPDGSLMTLVNDWVSTGRSNDGALQRTLDLKTLTPSLDVIDPDHGGLFQLAWSPRGDRFAVSWGAGPMFTTLFDAAGHRLKLPKADAMDGASFGSTKADFADGGEALVLCGMQDPMLVRLKTNAAIGLGDHSLPAVAGCATVGGGGEIALLADDRIAVWSLDGKRLAKPARLENFTLTGALATGAKDEVIVKAERGGSVDLYSKAGKFLRRVQAGTREDRGFVAVSADGGTIAALGTDGVGVITDQRQRAWGADANEAIMVAVSGDGSRIVARAEDNTLRQWSRDGAELERIVLKSADRVAEGKIWGIAVTPKGDAVAAVEGNKAVWLATDKTVRAVALAAQYAAALPDGSGFAVGLADGTIVRLARDGTIQGAPIKASELGGIDRVVIAPDGQSFIVVEGDARQARQLAWDGKVLAGPFRPSESEVIDNAFFGAFSESGTPRVLLRYVGPATDVTYLAATLSPPGGPERVPFEQPH